MYDEEEFILGFGANNSKIRTMGLMVHRKSTDDLGSLTIFLTQPKQRYRDYTLCRREICPVGMEEEEMKEEQEVPTALNTRKKGRCNSKICLFYKNKGIV